MGGMRRFFLRVYRCWVVFARAVAYVNTRVILGVLFFAVLTPVGLLCRLMGKDILGLKRGSSSSYWSPKEEGPFEPGRYRRQF